MVRKTPDTQVLLTGKALQPSQVIPQSSSAFSITKLLPAEADKLPSTDAFKQPPIEAVKQPPVETVKQPPTEEGKQPVAAAIPHFIHHRRRHSRGHSVTKVELPVDEETSPNSSANSSEGQSDSVTPTFSVGAEQTDTVEAKDVSQPTASLPSTSLPPASLPPSSQEDSAAAELSRSLPSPTPPSGVVHLRESHHLPRPQSAGSRIKLSPSVEDTLGELPRAATEREHPLNKVRSTSSAKDVSRRISTPPIHLINLFEPLSSGQVPATSPPRATAEAQLQKSSSLQESFTEPQSVPSFASLPTSGAVSPTPAHTYSLPTTSTPQQQPSRQSIPFQMSVDSEHLSGGEDLHISRTPSHPNLPISLSQPERECDVKTGTTIIRARSVTQLQEEQDEMEDESLKRRSYSGIRETVPVSIGPSQSEESSRSHFGLLRDHSGMRGSLEQLREEGRTAGPPAVIRLPLSHQNSPTKMDKDPFKRRISADPEKSHLSWMGKGKGRPRSMIETSSFHHGHHQSIDFGFGISSDFLAQLFWSSVSLLESDYEGEVLLALRLLNKVVSELDLLADSTYSRLEAVLRKMKWEKFPGKLNHNILSQLASLLTSCVITSLHV